MALAVWVMLHLIDQNNHFETKEKAGTVAGSYVRIKYAELAN